MGNVLLTVKDLKNRFKHDMDEAVDHGEVVGPGRKLWHAFEWMQSFWIVVCYFVTAICLISSWIFTQKMQLSEGLFMNRYYSTNNNSVTIAAQDCVDTHYNEAHLFGSYHGNLTDRVNKSCFSKRHLVANEGKQLETVQPFVTLGACEDACIANPACNSFSACNNGCFLYDLVISPFDPNNTHGHSKWCDTYFKAPCGNSTASNVTHDEHCKSAGLENDCERLNKIIFTFNISVKLQKGPSSDKSPFGDYDSLHLYMEAEEGYKQNINLKTDTACFGSTETFNGILHFMVFCAILTLTGGAVLLAFLECSGTFAPKYHKLHQLELKFKSTLRYFLIDIESENGKKPCITRCPRKYQDTYLSFMQYFFTTMIYNCMLAVFTKPGINFMGNNDEVFNVGKVYNGPGVWRPSAAPFVVYALMGAFAFFIFLNLLMVPCSVAKCIAERRCGNSAPGGPWLFIVSYIVAAFLVLNQLITYGISVFNGDIPTLDLSDFIFGISLYWKTFTFRVPNVQYPVAVSIFIVGTLKLSLFFSQLFIKCVLRSQKIKPMTNAEYELGQKTHLKNPNETEDGGFEGRLVGEACERVVARVDKKLNSMNLPPLNQPIFLCGANGNYLQNQDPKPHCMNKNKMLWESLTLESIGNDKFVLTSNRTGCRLQCKPDFTAEFANPNKGAWEELKVENNGNKFFFVSCFTGNVLQCNPESGNVRFDNRNRAGWEAFEVHTA